MRTSSNSSMSRSTVWTTVDNSMRIYGQFYGVLYDELYNLYNQPRAAGTYRRVPGTSLSNVCKHRDKQPASHEAACWTLWLLECSTPAA